MDQVSIKYTQIWIFILKTNHLATLLKNCGHSVTLFCSVFWRRRYYLHTCITSLTVYIPLYALSACTHAVGTYVHRRKHFKDTLDFVLCFKKPLGNANHSSLSRFDVGPLCHRSNKSPAIVIVKNYSSDGSDGTRMGWVCGGSKVFIPYDNLIKCRFHR
jgi:hypothetical protein